MSRIELSAQKRFFTSNSYSVRIRRSYKRKKLPLVKHVGMYEWLVGRVRNLI